MKKRFDNANRTNAVELTLELLGAVDDQSVISQRGLAARLDIALGLANTLVKRCVRKGLLKVQSIPKRRYAYYLTPKGFAEKSRLTAEYISTSLNFFRDARRQCDTLLESCENSSVKKVVLCGASDLAEITILASLDRQLEIIGIFDPGSNYNTLAGVPVFRSYSELVSFDVAIITDLHNPQKTFDYLADEYGLSNIIAAPLLNISTGFDCQIDNVMRKDS